MQKVKKSRSVKVVKAKGDIIVKPTLSRRESPYALVAAMFIGAFLAVGLSVWATTIGNGISVSQDITATGKLTINSTSNASSTIAYSLGVGTTTPYVMFSVGGAAGNTTGHGYFTGGLGAGIATTTAGAFENTGATLLGAVLNVTGAAQLNSTLNVTGLSTLPGGILVNNSTTTVVNLITVLSTSTQATTTYLTVSTNASSSALTVSNATDLQGNVTLGSNSSDTVTLNAATSTIATNANAHNVATSSADIPLLKFDSTNTRVGVSTTSPQRALSVGGDGTILLTGAGTSTLYLHSTGPKSGPSAVGSCIEFDSPAGTRLRLYATTSGHAIFETGGCRTGN